MKKIKYNFIEGERELSVDSILFIESNVHKLFFYTIGEKQFSFSLYGKLDKIADEFTPFKFLRIHKSFLVNTKYIENIKNYKVIMSRTASQGRGFGEKLSYRKLWRHSGIETDEDAYREDYGWRVKAEESPVTAGPGKGENGTGAWG